MRDDGWDRWDGSPRARAREVGSLDDHRLHLLDSFRGVLPLREAPRLGHPRHRGLLQHQTELPEQLFEVREGVIAVEGSWLNCGNRSSAWSKAFSIPSAFPSPTC